MALVEFSANLMRNWGREGVILCVGVFVFQVGNLVDFDKGWRHKKYLYYAYVVDFNYDKYCNMSWEDRFILEEISIYGVADCDDAKIPYKKMD